MRVAIAIVALVFASSAFVLQPSSAQVPGTGDLSGYVCVATPWGCDGPLPGATVTAVGGLLGTVEKEATTDEAGMYRLEDLPDGDYELTVSRKGFSSVAVAVTTAGDTVQDVELAPDEVQVAGRVLDAGGEPVAKAWIRFDGPRWQDAAADADGRFEVSLLAGWYDVRVEAPRHGALGQRLLVDGSDLLLELVPPPGQDAVIAGRVTDQDGQPVAGADVRVEQHETLAADGSRHYGYQTNWTATDASGAYRVHVHGGAVSLSFSKQGHAHEYRWLEMDAKETRTIDVELLRYPEKTARIHGQVTDVQGDGLPFISINVQHPEYGLWECSMRGSGGGARPGHEGSAEPAYAQDMSYGPSYHDPGCAIRVHADGTFEGNVTPGYAILSVRYDRWASCDETHHADGSYERSCGPDYFHETRTIDLAADGETGIDVALKQRPGADAAISGYLVDKETQKAIPGAHISFGHQDAHSWGSAATDGDGSYQVRLRSGVHEVHVWAEGYLPWQGTVDVQKGQELPLDVVLTRGESRYGGCCYGVADDASMASGASGEAPAKEASGAGQTGSQDDAFEDMRGGLGPYDPQKRAQLLEAPAKKDAPVPMVLAVAAVALAGLRRRS